MSPVITFLVTVCAVLIIVSAAGIGLDRSNDPWELVHYILAITVGLWAIITVSSNIHTLGRKSATAFLMVLFWSCLVVYSAHKLLYGFGDLPKISLAVLALTWISMLATTIACVGICADARVSPAPGEPTVVIVVSATDINKPETLPV
jgi:hypothetical protein